MNRIAATMKQLVAEVIGDGHMFDKATQEQAMAHSGRPIEKAGEGSSNVASPNLHPMKDFNPAEPAILHDVVNNRMITWDWERAEDFRKNAVWGADGRVAWGEFVFDGWGNVLGG
jgi:hypothetical protein